MAVGIFYVGKVHARPGVDRAEGPKVQHRPAEVRPQPHRRQVCPLIISIYNVMQIGTVYKFTLFHIMQIVNQKITVKF